MDEYFGKNSTCKVLQECDSLGCDKSKSQRCVNSSLTVNKNQKLKYLERRVFGSYATCVCLSEKKTGFLCDKDTKFDTIRGVTVEYKEHEPGDTQLIDISVIAKTEEIMRNSHLELHTENGYSLMFSVASHMCSDQFKKNGCKIRKSTIKDQSGVDWLLNVTFLIPVKFPYKPYSKEDKSVLKLDKEIYGYMGSLTVKAFTKGVEASAYVYNQFVSYWGATENCNITSNRGPCKDVGLVCMPVFTLSNCGPWPWNPVTIAPFTTLEISRKLEFYQNGQLYLETLNQTEECVSQVKKSMLDGWKLWKYDVNHTEHQATLLKSSTLLIKPYMLDFGVHTVFHSVSVIQAKSSSTNFQYCYVQVNTLPLVPQVEGGSVRKVFKEYGIILKSKSYDPNFPRDKQDHLRIGWSCQFEKDPVCKLRWRGPHEAYRIEPKYLRYDTMYKFSMIVTTHKYDDCAQCSPVGPQYAVVVINVEKKVKITPNQTELSIECARNCGERALADRQMVLKLRFSHRIVDAAYEWTYVKDAEGAKAVDDLVKSVNSRATHILVIEENKLEEGSMYTVSAKDTKTEWAVTYTFLVDQIVYNGTCTVSPETGEKGFEEFEIECSTPPENFRFEFYDKTEEEMNSGEVFNGRMLGTSYTGYIRARITRGNIIIYAYNVNGCIIRKTVTVNLRTESYKDDETLVNRLFSELEAKMDFRDAIMILGYLSIIPDVLPADVVKTDIAKLLFKAFALVDESRSDTMEMIKMWTSTASNVLRSLTKPEPVAIDVASWARMMAIVSRVTLVLSERMGNELNCRCTSPSQIKSLTRKLLSCVLVLLDTMEGRFVEVDEENTDLITLYDLKTGSNYAATSIVTLKGVLCRDQAGGQPATKLETKDGRIAIWLMSNDEGYTIQDMLEDNREIPVSISKNLQIDLERRKIRDEVLSLQVAVLNRNLFWWGKSNVESSTLTSVDIGKHSAGNKMTYVSFVDNPLRVMFSYNSTAVKKSASNGTVKLDPKSDLDDLDLAVRIHRLDVPPRSLVKITFKFASPDESLRVLVLTKRRPDYESMNESGTVINDNKHGFWEYLIPDEPTFMYLGVMPGPEVPANTEVRYSFEVGTKVCQTWANSHWTSSGCWIVARCGGEGAVCCDCNHFSIFTSAFPVPPEEIDPFADAKLFLTVFDNPLVVVLVSCLLLLYLILCLIMWRKDHHDRRFTHVLVLDDNFPQDSVPYLLAVHTGSRCSAGTTACVGVRLMGEDRDSRAHLLTSCERKVLQRNMDDWFVIFCPEPLGNLTGLHIWHDNSGSSPEWYCEKVVVYDLVNRTETRFYVEQWLALRENYFPEAKVLLAKIQDIRSLKRTFIENLVYGLWQNHMFISAVCRHPRSEITRAQRLSILMCCIMVTLLCTIMFYQISGKTTSDTMPDDYHYSMSLKEFYVSIQSLVISLVITMFVIFLFRMSYYYVELPRKSTLMVRNSESLDFLIQRKKDSSLKEVKSIQSKEVPSLYENFVRLTSKVIRTHPMTPVQTRNCEPVVKRRTGWYVAAWVVCLTVIASCAYLVMLYGLKLGHVQSLKWLTSVFLSMGEEVFLTGPTRIVTGAVIMSMAYRTLFDVNTQRVLVDKVMSLRPRNTDDNIEEIISKRTTRTYAPLREEITQAMLREYRKKKQCWIVTDFTLAFCFLVVLHNVIFSLWSSHYYANSNVCRVIGHPHLPTIGGISFNDVTDIPTMETYLSHTFVYTVFNLRWYNNELIEKGDADTKYWAGNCVHRMIGQPVVRQNRIIPELCENLVGLTGHCMPPPSRAVRDTDFYDYGWATARHHTDIEDKISPWKFTEPLSSRMMARYRLTGSSGHVYDDGGYQTTLGVTRLEAENTANNLAAAHWQTTRTRALFLELTLYNVNEDMFNQVTLIVEYLEAGVTLIRAKGTSVKYSMNYNMWQFLFVLLVLYYTVTCLYFINHHGLLEHLSRFNGFCRLCDVVLGLVAIGLFLAHYFVSIRFAKKFQREGKDIYFDFDHFLFFFGEVKIVLTVLLCFAILRAFLLIRLGRRLMTHFYTLVISWQWALWLTGLALFTYFIFYFISMLLAIFAPSGMMSITAKLDCHDQTQCLLLKQYLVFKDFVFSVFSALFFVMFTYYYRIAAGYKIESTDSFNFFTFLVDSLKRRRRRS